MQHSIKDIGGRYEVLSKLRKEKIVFNSDEFFNFAKANKTKYCLIEMGEDFLVSTWYTDSLISDFKKSIS